MSDFWEETLAAWRPEWINDLVADYAYAESLRYKAAADTGTINPATGLALRALCERYRPEIIVEIGTFIGKSTLSLRARHIFTCDLYNDCLPSTKSRTCFPKTLSTQMLRALPAALRVDLFFFDGRILPDDVQLILRLSKPTTVYAFDDYRGEEKGVLNARILGQQLPDHQLVHPASFGALAVLVPR